MSDRLVVVLNDGETYTDIDGCKIILVPGYVVEADNNTSGTIDAYVKAVYNSEGISVVEQLVKDRAAPEPKSESVLGHCTHGYDLDHSYCPYGCRY